MRCGAGIRRIELTVMKTRTYRTAVTQIQEEEHVRTSE